jgi:hypothetical protein
MPTWPSRRKEPDVPAQPGSADAPATRPQRTPARVPMLDLGDGNLVALRPGTSVKIERSLADICIVFDTTGSMSDKIDGLINCMTGFVDQLGKLSLDWQISVVPFGDLTVPGDRVELQLPFVKTVDLAKQQLRQMPRFSGGANQGESSIDAILGAIGKPWRNNTVRIAVLLTDEPALGTHRGFLSDFRLDHLVLDLGEDERGPGDVAYLAGVRGDALECHPALLHQGETAFSLVAQAAQQRVAGSRAGVQLSLARLLHRDVDAFPGALVAGVGQDRHAFEVGAGGGQDLLAGGGDVVGAAGQGVRRPQRHAAGADEALDEPGVVVRLAGIPFVYFCALTAGFLVGAAVGGNEGAVEDEIGKSLLSGFLQGLVQGGGLRGEHCDSLILVPVGRGLGDPEALAEAADVRLVTEPRKDEDGLVPAAQGAGSAPGADVGAVPGQQGRDLEREGQGHVESDPIIDHAEPSVKLGLVVRPLLPGLRTPPGIFSYIRVSACSSAYIAYVRLGLAEKTSL